MKFITNETNLRTFLPNAFTSVEGETSLFDKLQPFLIIAEHWLQQQVLGEATLASIAQEDSDANILCCQIVVSEGFSRAIPSLDLVLTPNGFGIVSNSNVAPASKERVERLIAQLQDNRDTYLQSLLAILPSREEWLGTAQQLFFAGTLFPNTDIVDQVGRRTKTPKWPQYVALRYELIDIEHSLAEEYFSEELMSDLRAKAHVNNLSDAYAHILPIIRAQELAVLQKLPIQHRQMTDVVNFIRKHPDEFPLWHASDTAKLYDPPVFQNKKIDTAYWL